MVNFEFEARDQELLDSWKTLAKDRIAPLAAKVDEGGALFDELLQCLRETGLLTPFLPTDLGGEGRGLMSLVLLLEEIAKSSPVVAILAAQQVIIGIRCLLRVSNHPERKDWAKQAAGFQAFFPMAATEAAAGSDLRRIETLCRESGANAWTIHGGKAYVNWAGRAKAILTMTRVEGREPFAASMFFIPCNSKGLEIGDSHATMGMAGLEAAPVKFNDVQVSGEQLAGVHAFGYDLYDQVMNEMRIAIGAIAVGISQGSFDEAAGYAKTRKQFGKPVGSFQSLQWRFSDMAIKIESGRLQVWNAVEISGDKGSAFKTAAMAKIVATEAACAVTDFAVQAMGSQGYIRGSVSERLFRDARFLKIGFGTSETLRNLVAAQL